MISAKEIDWDHLITRAWKVRDNAVIIGPTKVGCAVLADTGAVFCGCNIEHRYRSHCVHAEVNALTSMAAATTSRATALVIAAERDRFTPCGACLDWIFQLGTPDTLVTFSPKPGRIGSHIWRADELMPYYPS